MVEQRPSHFSPEHVQTLQEQANPRGEKQSLYTSPSEFQLADTPLVDMMIQRVRDEMAKPLGLFMDKIRVNWITFVVSAGLKRSNPPEENTRI